MPKPLQGNINEDSIERPDSIIDIGDLALSTVYGEMLPGIIVLYKEKWQDLGQLHSKTYVVYIDSGRN